MLINFSICSLAVHDFVYKQNLTKKYILYIYCPSNNNFTVSMLSQLGYSQNDHFITDFQMFLASMFIYSKQGLNIRFWYCAWKSFRHKVYMSRTLALVNRLSFGPCNTDTMRFSCSFFFQCQRSSFIDVCCCFSRLCDMSDHADCCSPVLAGKGNFTSETYLDVLSYDLRLNLTCFKVSAQSLRIKSDRHGRTWVLEMLKTLHDHFICIHPFYIV